jgi:hypothetical protein
MDEQSVFVGEIQHYQASRKFCTAMRDYVLAGLRLKPPDFDRKVTVRNLRLGSARNIPRAGRRWYCGQI